MSEKLQKVLAANGVGSRREMERWISAGRISVNGKLATLGDRVEDEDKIVVDGRPLQRSLEKKRRRVLLYNKPEGEICSRNDPEGRRSVFDRLPRLHGERWISVGRLDFNTSGLLLFTTDGALANQLMHPSSVIEREYLCRVMGDVTPEKIKAMTDGVMLEDGLAKFTDVVESGGEGINRWFYVVVMEGRNREVRRLWESQELTVSRLKRVRYGDVFIPSEVRSGQWIELSQDEINGLADMSGAEKEDKRPLTRAEKETRDRHHRKLRRHGGKK
ncbi:23S rRNA pseudouridine2605 synthase [Sinobacterium caligoides]|uniref:Pseudouridine synthase n=1 Tax=Sinobacterium caligoides TaxID=933926 RepID=A0A3N2DZ26_9GAMM|nr:pseudouridine synthase [Sinobacterium caligoides]ROS04749.1 23S rRNA pseudouridine2605 synthase [Sinobacterium caligoides]